MTENNMMPELTLDAVPTLTLEPELDTPATPAPVAAEPAKPEVEPVKLDESMLSEQEKKAVDAHAAKKEDGSPDFTEDGRLKLKDAESKNAFEVEILRLQETEIDGIVPVKLCEEDFLTTNDLPTASDMLILEGIVDFAD